MARITSAEKIAKMEMSLEGKKQKIEKLQEEVKMLEKKIQDEKYKSVKGKTNEISEILINAGISDPFQLDMLIEKFKKDAYQLKNNENENAEDSDTE